jgi:hypothetical protein
MNPKFQSATEAKDGFSILRLSGVIDEDNELGTLAGALTGNVVINTGEVERINSCGVRDWVNWLQRGLPGSSILLVDCSPAIVAQINLVNNFTGDALVKSFYAPYFCPKCDLEKVLLVEATDLEGQRPVRAPACRCDECDGPMDFDDIEDSYFAFLSSSKKVVTGEIPLASLYDQQSLRRIGKSRGQGEKPGSKPNAKEKDPSGGGSADKKEPSLPSVPSLGSSAQVVSSDRVVTEQDSGERHFGPDEAAVKTVPVTRYGDASTIWTVVIVLLLGMAVLLGYLIF